MVEETGKAITKEDEGIYPFALIVGAANRALKRTEGVVKEHGFGLKSGDITFKTVTTNGWGLTLTLFVVTLKFSDKHRSTSTDVVHYKDPDKGNHESLIAAENLLPIAFMLKHKDKTKSLEDALAEHVEALTKAQLDQLGGKPENGFDVTMEFGVVLNFEIDVTVPTPYITVGGSFSHDKNKTHSVKLVFEKLRK